MRMCDWVTGLRSRNRHNITNQLYFNKKITKNVNGLILQVKMKVKYIKNTKPNYMLLLGETF